MNTVDKPSRAASSVGIALGFAAYALLAAQDAVVKILVTDLPVPEVLFCRTLVVVGGCLALGRTDLMRRAATSKVRGIMCVRGALTFGAWLCYFSAARSLPLAQLVTLWFTAPVLVVILAALLLKEHVGLRQWLAVGLGFAGAAAAAEPAAISAGLPAGLALGGALLWATGLILSRIAGKLEPPSVQMLATNCVFLIATTLMSVRGWRVPSAGQVWLCALVGGLSGLGQLALLEAIRRLPASKLAPVEYTALPWGFLLGLALWGDVPRFSVFAGASLIVAAGLVVIFGEQRRLTVGLVARP